MNVQQANAFQRSLPQLSGRLLWLYQGLWCVLCVGDLAISAQLPFQSGLHPAVLILRLVKAAILIAVAVILFRRRGRDPVAALLSLAFLTWTITSSFDFGTHALLPQLLDRCRFVLFGFALLLFPDGKWQPPWTRAVASASAAVFLLGLAETLQLTPTHLFLPLAIGCIVAGIVSLVYRFGKEGDYAARQQLKWVALGLSAGVGLILLARGGAAVSAAAPRDPVITILWEAMFQLGIVIVALGFLVSLLRYRLFDAETVITRSAAYAGLTIALVATFGGTEAAIGNLGQAYLGMNVGSISGAMAAAVAAVLLNPLHHRITDWAEHRFQPDLAKLKREMPDLLAHLSATSSTSSISSAVLLRINMAIHATRSALLLDGRVAASCEVTVDEASRWWRNAMRVESPLGERNPGDPLFPVRLPLGSAPSGSAMWLLVGPRPDGTLYGREDLDAVRSTFPALRHALTSALMREALHASVDRREECLRRELGEIRSRLDELEVARREGHRKRAVNGPAAE